MTQFGYLFEEFKIYSRKSLKRRNICGTTYVYMNMGNKPYLLLFAGVDYNDILKIHRHGGADLKGGQHRVLYVTIKVGFLFLVKLH